MPFMSGNSIDPQPTRHKDAPQIFNPVRIALNQTRGARRRERLESPQFIFAHIAEDIAQRILMINRQFQNALIICPDGFGAILEPHLDTDKRPRHLTLSTMQNLGPILRGQTGYDLMVLVMAHQNENNPQGLLKALKGHMVDDGHIMTVCLGGESLAHLRRSLYAADQAHFGGMSARFHPLMDIQKNVQILSHCGFNLATGDRDRLTVHYKKFATIIHDLRDLGESYALAAQPIKPTSRAFWNTVKTKYKTEFSDSNRFIANFDILWASAWTPHDSQQKPLKPGSGKIHLSRAFKP